MMKMGIRISHTAKVWPSNGSLLMNETPTFKQKCAGNYRLLGQDRIYYMYEKYTSWRI